MVGKIRDRTLEDATNQNAEFFEKWHSDWMLSKKATFDWWRLLESHPWVKLEHERRKNEGHSKSFIQFDSENLFR